MKAAVRRPGKDGISLPLLLGYGWQASSAERSAEATTFVRNHLRRILHGEIGIVLAVWRRQATCQGLRGAKKKTLAALCAFLEKNKHRMKSMSICAWAVLWRRE